MSDPQQIERFIAQHRAGFEAAPPADGWDRLEATMQRLAVNSSPVECFIACNRPIFDVEAPSDLVWDQVSAQIDAVSLSANTDALESFIHRHREDFDVETPDLLVWKNLSSHPSPSPMRVSWGGRLYRVAAAIALLITGAGMGLWWSAQQAGAEAGMRMADISGEYAEMEQYFERDIATKQQALAQFASQPSSAEVFNDLQQIDQVMQELRIELANVPPGNREQVVRAMIENYKTKAAVMERVLKMLQQNASGQNSPSSPTFKEKSNYETESI